MIKREGKGSEKKERENDKRLKEKWKKGKMKKKEDLTFKMYITKKNTVTTKLANEVHSNSH